jgi:hypothetical protein
VGIELANNHATFGATTPACVRSGKPPLDLDTRRVAESLLSSLCFLRALPIRA